MVFFVISCFRDFMIQKIFYAFPRKYESGFSRTGELSHETQGHHQKMR